MPTITPGVVETTTSPPETSSTEIPATTRPPTESPSTEKTTMPTMTPGVVETTTSPPETSSTEIPATTRPPTESPSTEKTTTPTITPGVVETTTSPPETSSTEIPATTRPPTESPSTEKTTMPTMTPGVVETTTSPPETSSTEIPATTRPPTESPSTEKTTTPTITPGEEETTTPPETPTTTPCNATNFYLIFHLHQQNETFWLCNCTLARCIEDNIIEIIPYECPPLQNITCANGMPPVEVWDENYCCKRHACDCYCEGWGDPHYMTFDGLSYSHQGNCTYVLMEETVPKYNFKIYVDNVRCDPTEDVSCPRAVIVSFNSLVITLKNQNLMGPSKLEAIKDGKTLPLPYAMNGVSVSSSSLKLILKIPQLQIVVTFGIIGFTVHLPYQFFGGNTQGHCGTCNNNQADDCMIPGGQLVHDCAVMADFWPAKDIYRPDCPVPTVVPTGSPKPQPTMKPCNSDSACDLLTSSLFAECHEFVSPDRFYQSCVFDSCHMSNPTVECTSLQVYAETCSEFGVCIYWRNHTTMCGKIDCSPGKVYKPCGPASQPSCDDNPTEPVLNVMVEGCFCPEGQILFSKESTLCVDKCGCLDPEGIVREFNERFEYNCQDCLCEETTKTVTCKPKVCSNPGAISCNEPGFIIANETDPDDSCCSKLTCRCDSRTCPPSDMKCNVGYTPVVTVPDGKCCPEYTCESKKVCVHKGLEYEPGTTIPVVDCQECNCTMEVDPKSNLFKVRCGWMSCPETCEHGYEYVDTDPYACCGQCVQTHCAVSINGSVQLTNHHPPIPCLKVDGTFMVTKSKIQCPPFQQSNCQPVSIQHTTKDQACKVETMLKTITYKGCQSVEEVEMTYCEGSCNTYSKYSELEASMKHTCTCCRESRTSNRTVDLFCLNGITTPYTYTHVHQCQCSETDCRTRRPLV
uniref:Uncharacterized protein n=1 Tax=Denticeps clupeoides TaxID=299321 RepID=A0AAY4DDJ6_9TELE